jgi:SAM-dependent methyltransferase
VMNLFKKFHKEAESSLDSNPWDLFPLTPELPLPLGVLESELRGFLSAVRVADAPVQEMLNYCQQDFKRFVYTYGLVQNLSGKCLELGANPYFTTILLRQFTQLDLTLANYFNSNYDNLVNQEVYYKDFKSKESYSIKLQSNHFNIENDVFPFSNEEFDIVLFCEIIEHLLLDPVAVIKEIKRILKPNGVLVLTTPNVSRLENVSKAIAGSNIYDPYSGYGPYGRHNREYNKHELYLLLSYLGFTIESMFTADVHQNDANNYVSVSKLKSFLEHREHDLGQYIFVKAINSQPAGQKKPAFLYRSLPTEQLE